MQRFTSCCRQNLKDGTDKGGAFSAYHKGTVYQLVIIIEPRYEKAGIPGLRPGPTQKMARGLKFRIWVVEVLNYPYSENKGADQLRGYREADLRLCFRICKNPVFSGRGSYHKHED